MEYIKKFFFTLIVGLVGLCLSVAVGLAIFTLALIPDLPEIESINDIQLKVPLRVYSKEGLLIAEYGDERRIPINIDDLQETLVDAILAAEDSAFFEHPGVDFVGVLRAIIANLQSGEHGQGASTITMQVARNYFLTREKTYTRKLKEALLAFRIENALNKYQILELYLNKIFLGHRAYGFAAAAKVYYGRPLGQLELPEIAMLAGLPKAPSTNNPLSNPSNALKRRNYVLKRLRELEKINEATYQEAVETPLTASKHIAQAELQAPYTAEIVRRYMLDHYGEQAYQAGYKVYTTINADYQRAADKSLQKGLLDYSIRHGYRGRIDKINMDKHTTTAALDEILLSIPQVNNLIPAVVLQVEKKSANVYNKNKSLVKIDWKGVSWARPYIKARAKGRLPKKATEILKKGDIVYIQKDEKESWRLSQVPAVSGALISLNPHDGAILALSGGFDFYRNKFNHVTQAQRQPGSNLKPFIYSAALEHGFTPATLVSGAPIVVADPSFENIWRPENYSGKFFGPTRIRRALALSLNLVSIRLLRAIGSESAIQHLERFGFDAEQLPKGLSLALGTASMTPLQVATGYAVFANGGYRISPYLISHVEDRNKRIIEQAHPPVACSSCLIDKGAYESPTGLKLAPRAISVRNTFLMNSLLRGVVQTGTGRKAKQLGRKDLAGKTGTTNNFHDAWFSGFNPDVVTTTWVGFNQPADLGRGEAGSRVALPIWIDYMKVALEGKPEKPLPLPDNIVTTFVHKDSGTVANPEDPTAYEEFFYAGTQPNINENGELTPEMPFPNTDNSTKSLF